MAERVPSSLALWKPFSNKGRSLLRRDIVCLHTMVGSLPGSWSWANGSGRAYWHFGISGTGECWQCHPLEYRSASNLHGNPYVIPIENADMGPGFGSWNGRCGSVPPFTTAQVNKLVALIAYLCRRYNIPAVFIPDTRAGRRGIAWHRQGIPGWPEWKGGLLWSSAAGKCCPDGARIHQLKTIILPRVRAALGGAPPPQPQPGGFLMALSDSEQRELLSNTRWLRSNVPTGDSFNLRVIASVLASFNEARNAPSDEGAQNVIAHALHKWAMVAVRNSVLGVDIHGRPHPEPVLRQRLDAILKAAQDAA